MYFFFFRVRSQLAFVRFVEFICDCHFVYMSFVYSGVVFCVYLYSAAVAAGVNATLRNVIYLIGLCLL